MNRPFTPFDIIWIKNVTSKTGQAYMNLPSDNFVLHFPTTHKTNAGSPLVGEIILVYQKINGKNVFTHLVTEKQKIDPAFDKFIKIYLEFLEISKLFRNESCIDFIEDVIFMWSLGSA